MSTFELFFIDNLYCYRFLYSHTNSNHICYNEYPPISVCSFGTPRQTGVIKADIIHVREDNDRYLIN